MAFSWYIPLTVNSSQVSGTLTDFPAAVFGTFADLKTVGNGGFVQNASGYDIGFYSDSGLTTKLKWETVAYNATTGAVVYWVKVPSIATSTVIYMAFGDSGISTDQSDTVNTWDSNYYGVWHLPDGTTLTANDSTSQANNGTVSTPTAVAGKVEGGASFNGTTDYIGLTNNLGLRPAGTFTVSGWLKLASSTSNFVIFESYSQTTAVSGISIGMNVFGVAAAQHHLSMVKGKNSGFGMTDWGGYSGTTTIDDGNWHHFAIVNDSSNAVHIYIDGAADEATRPFGNDYAPAYNVTTYSNIGKEKYDPSTEGKFWPGQLDEIRYSNGIDRSAAWANAEYNNQNSFSGFFTTGSKVSTGGVTNHGFFF